MVKRRKALGRGLEALLGEKSKKYNSNIFKEIDIDKIKIYSKKNYPDFFFERHSCHFEAI